MAAPPYLKFFVRDFLADTVHLTAMESWAYVGLLFAMWQAGGDLPDDDVRVARYIKLTRTQWARVKPAVMELLVVEDGRLSSARLTAEIEAVSQHQQVSSAGGRAKALKSKQVTPAERVRNACHPDADTDTDVKSADALLTARARERVARVLWALQPSVGGAPSSTQADIKTALHPLVGLVSEAELSASATAYYGLPKFRGDKARYAKGVVWLLEDNRWVEFSPATAVNQRPTWAGPAEIRDHLLAAHGLGFVGSYLDTARWEGEAIVPATRFAHDKLAAALKDTPWAGLLVAQLAAR